MTNEKLIQRCLAPLGHTVWHCSDEDGGLPDVGIGVALPDGSELYFGEISDQTLEDNGVDPKGSGWAVVHIVDGELNILATHCTGHLLLMDDLESLAISMKSKTLSDKLDMAMEALSPFAIMGEMANFAPALFADGDGLKSLPWSSAGEPVTITFGDVRRASTTLKELSNEQA